MPWQSGLTGIAYNAKLTKEVRSFDELLTRPDLKGKVSLLSEMHDTMLFMLLLEGADPEDFTDEEFGKAIDRLQKATDAGQIRAFTGNEYAQDLVKGNVVACEAWSGDIIQLQFDNPDIKFVAPEEGLALWSDNMLVPNKAEHRANAEELMNFYYDPVNAATLAAWVNYICPVEGAPAGHGEDRLQPRRQPADLPERGHPGQGQGLHGPGREDRAELPEAVRCGDRSLIPMVDATPRPGRARHARGRGGGPRRSTSVTKKFGAFVAVDELDLVVEQGKFFALLGPSGLRQDHDAADGRRPRGADQRDDHDLGDRDISRLKPYKRPVNTVFQNYALFPHLDDLRERRLRPAPPRGQGRQEAGPGHARARRARGASASAARRSSPAASSSGSPSPAR